MRKYFTVYSAPRQELYSLVLKKIYISPFVCAEKFTSNVITSESRITNWAIKFEVKGQKTLPENTKECKKNTQFSKVKKKTSITLEKFKNVLYFKSNQKADNFVTVVERPSDSIALFGCSVFVPETYYILKDGIACLIWNNFTYLKFHKYSNTFSGYSRKYG